MKAAESLAWKELGIGAKNIVHTFVSTGNTSVLAERTMNKHQHYLFRIATGQQTAESTGAGAGRLMSSKQ